MGNLGDSLRDRINQLGIARQVVAAGMVEKATEEIAKYIPREDFEVISFKKGVLKIGVQNSSVANHFRLTAETTLKKKHQGIKKVQIILSSEEGF